MKVSLLKVIHVLCIYLKFMLTASILKKSKEHEN